MRKKVLGAYMLAQEDVAPEQAQMIGMGIMLQFGTMGNLKWDGAMKTAYEVPIDRYESPEHAMYAFITQNHGDGNIKDRNTAIFWHDTTFADLGMYCCLLVKGRMDEYPSATTVFGDYIGKPITPKAPDDIAAVAAAAVSGTASKEIPEEAEEFYTLAQMFEATGKLEQAAEFYMQALQFDMTNLTMLRKFLNVALQIDELDEGVFDVCMALYPDIGLDNLEGEDFGYLAKGIYANIKKGHGPNLDLRLQEHGITAEGYMLSAISDARYLGYDCDEFAEIEKAVGVDSGEGGGSGGGDAKKSAFFNRG